MSQAQKDESAPPRSRWGFGRSSYQLAPPDQLESAEQILRSYLDQKLAELGPLRHTAQRLLEEHLIDGQGNRRLLTDHEARAALPGQEADEVLAHLEQAAV